jgi:uncharacterized membrane protein YqjE
MSTQDSNREPGKGGLLDSVKNLLFTVISMGQTRLELLSVELEEERERLTDMLIWTLVTLFFAGMAVVLFTMLMLVIFWDSYRLVAIGIMLGIFVVGTVISWRNLCNTRQNKPRIFSATITELSKDSDELRSPNEY